VDLRLGNLCEVYIDPHGRTAAFAYVGGSSETINDDEASDLGEVLLDRATVPTEPHRTVFAPARI
jgi:hypothetical protein